MPSLLKEVCDEFCFSLGAGVDRSGLAFCRLVGTLEDLGIEAALA